MKLGPRFIRHAVVIVAMAGLLLALQAAAVTAAPPGAPPAQYGAVTCGNGGTCTTPSGTVSVGAGALPAGYTVVVYPPAIGSLIPPAAPGTVLVGDLLVIEVHDANGNLVTPFNLNPPLTVCMLYNADQLNQAGGDPNNFRIRYFDPATAQWVDAGPSTVDMATSQVCTQVSHLSLFSLFARTPGVLPVTGGEPADNTAFLFLGAALLSLGLAFIGARRLARV
jgi:hypothetical protein